ncbi:MAG: Holliday junction branch migration protein RuvA [Dehalococcoidia bacterium]|nr:Holliday junction branch migration protein RuvA [Dehalococcoidia bacterium]
MISSLRGNIESLSAEYAVINVRDVGFQVFMPASALLALGNIGDAVRVHIHTYVREDAILLYGFASEDDKKLFEMLINVSGFGPKLALALLSAMSVEQLVSAIAAGSEELLTSIPGVGKKLAGRLVLELRDKVKTGWTGARVVLIGEEDGEVVAALLGLGYSASEASNAVAALPRGKKLTLEEKVKAALGYFGKS